MPISAGVGALIAEQAPDKHRGAYSGVAQILWYLGPVAVLLAGYNGFFTPYLIEQNHPPQWAATVLPAG